MEDQLFTKETYGILLELKEQQGEMLERLAKVESKLDPDNEHYINKKIEAQIATWNEVYNGIILGKKIIAGLAVVVVGIASIGGGILWLINHLPHKT